MVVNHGGRIARLRGGQVFIGMCGKVEAAKGMSQAVALAGHFRIIAQREKLLLPNHVNTRCFNWADFAFEFAKWFKPCSQGRADFHKAALARLALSCRDFNMVWSAPNVGPCQTQDFGWSQSSKPADSNRCTHWPFCRRQQGAKLFWRVKLNFAIIRIFAAHGIGFKQAVRYRQITISAKVLPFALMEASTYSDTARNKETVRPVR